MASGGRCPSPAHYVGRPKVTGGATAEGRADVDYRAAPSGVFRFPPVLRVTEEDERIGRTHVEVPLGGGSEDFVERDV